MHFLELILPEEIQNRASGISQHRLRPDALDMDVAGQRCRSQQVLLARQQHLGFIGAGPHGVGVLSRGFRIHVSCSEHALHFVVRSQE